MNTDNPQTKPVSDWTLEQYLLGDLPEAETADIAAYERDDNYLREKIDVMRRSDTEILQAYPPAWMARRIATAYAQRTTLAPKTRTGWFPPFAVPAAVCLALLIMLPLGLRTIPSINNATDLRNEDRVKGIGLTAPALEVWRKEGDTARKLAPLSVAKTGDLVQLRYAVPEFCYGALVSVDSRRLLTVHLSGDSGEAAPLAPEGFVPLDMSYQLDDAPRFEVFYLITAPEKFNLDSVTKPLADANHPVNRWDGRSHTKITAFTLRKS